MTDHSALRDPLIEALGVVHGFGTRTSRAPETTLRPIQVHGVDVMRVARDADPTPREADVIVCGGFAQSVGIVTADCVPILACAESGTAVAAIHAGWRGLAAGVVEAGIQALREVAPPGSTLFAAIGPHIGACCYEVDGRVLDAMEDRFGSAHVREASHATRDGHARLDLALISQLALDRSGVAQTGRARFDGRCTACDDAHFHSFRRDGEAAGRMGHYIVSR